MTEICPVERIDKISLPNRTSLSRSGPPSAFADQCQGLPQKEAERALMLLQKGSVIMENCEPCGGGIEKIQVINSVETGSFNLGTDIYTTVKVNGKEIDLAYTFLKVAPNKFVNVAKAIYCSSLDPRSVSTVMDKVGTPLN